MADKGGGAYATKASDTDFRKKWDKEEYAEKAKKRDLEERERMQENEERLKQGESKYMLNTILYQSTRSQGRDRERAKSRIYQSPQNS